MGFDLNRFASPDEINDEFICTICQEVMLDPVCTECEHNFCRACIEEWLGSNPRCPIDRKELVLGHLRPSPRFFRNLIGSLEIACSFAGCSSSRLKLEDVALHEMKCAFNPNVESFCETCGGLVTREAQPPDHNCVEYLKATLADTKSKFERVDKEKEEKAAVVSRQEEQLREQGTKIERLQRELLTKTVENARLLSMNQKQTQKAERKASHWPGKHRPFSGGTATDFNSMPQPVLTGPPPIRPPHLFASLHPSAPPLPTDVPPETPLQQQQQPASIITIPRRPNASRFGRTPRDQADGDGGPPRRLRSLVSSVVRVPSAMFSGGQHSS